MDLIECQNLQHAKLFMCVQIVIPPMVNIHCYSTFGCVVCASLQLFFSSTKTA
jgi:hypothetical protein